MIRVHDSFFNKRGFHILHQPQTGHRNGRITNFTLILFSEKRTHFIDDGRNVETFDDGTGRSV